MKDAKYILWLDYGTEGWQPYYFETLADVAAYIESGHTHGSTIKITKHIPLKIKEGE
jgi:hypothetical protein